MNVNKININQSELTYDILSDAVPLIGDYQGTFGIQDASGNIIGVLERGHIRTNSFDSTKTPIVEDTNDDGVCLSDDNGNIGLELLKGHIRTKEFDSSKLRLVKEDYKNILIIQ